MVRWLAVLNILPAVVVIGALAAGPGSAADKASDKAPDKAPLAIELVPTQVVLDRGQPGDVFVIVANTGTSPLTDLRLAVHMPAELASVTASWEVDGQRVAGALQVGTVLPQSQAQLTLRLASSDPWSAAKSGTIVVTASYTWPLPAGPARPGRLARGLTVKLGTLDALQVLGVPVALAIFIVPGMLGVMLFQATLRSPPKWVDDNRLFVSFLASIVLILGWNHLRDRLNGPDLWSGVSVEVLLLFTVGAGVIGAVAGAIVRRFQRTAAERWPLRSGLDLPTILAHAARRKALPTTSSRIGFKDRTVLSALVVDSDAADEIVLLPRRYRITTKDETLKTQFVAALSGGTIGARFAALIEKQPTLLGVADGIKRLGPDGEWTEEPEGEQPMHRPRADIVSRVPESPGDTPLVVVSP